MSVPCFSLRTLALMLAVLLAGVGGAPFPVSLFNFRASASSKGMSSSFEDFSPSNLLLVVFRATLALSPPRLSSDRSPLTLRCGGRGSSEGLASPLTLPSPLPPRIDPFPVGWRESGWGESRFLSPVAESRVDLSSLTEATFETVDLTAEGSLTDLGGFTLSDLTDRSLDSLSSRGSLRMGSTGISSRTLASSRTLPSPLALPPQIDNPPQIEPRFDLVAGWSRALIVAGSSAHSDPPARAGGDRGGRRVGSELPRLEPPQTEFPRTGIIEGLVEGSVRLCFVVGVGSFA